MPQSNQTYNDGLVTIYGISNAGELGNAPEPVLAKKVSLRYEERTVGVTRYYAALQANAMVDMVLRCQRAPAVSPQDVAVLHDGRQYRITLVQIPRDAQPPSMDLTLERMEAHYELP